MSDTIRLFDEQYNTLNHSHYGQTTYSGDRGGGEVKGERIDAFASIQSKYTNHIYYVCVFVDVQADHNI